MTRPEQGAVSIDVVGLGKCYQIYERPVHRLQQFILPRLDAFRGREPRACYKEFWALKDLSFTVSKGEVVGIIGRNGSGKSTLLQMICGTLAPTAGTVATHGRVAALLELGSGFNPDFTGRENVYLNGTVLGLSEREIDARYDDIAAFADIGDFIDQPVKTYSSGMVMRLAFAVSVCVDPDILVIDEALAVGDAAFQFKCMERMKRLTESGTTLLFVSHDMGMVKSFCHWVLYLEQGREKMRGQPDKVAEQYFLDIRDEQRRHATGGMPVFRKKALGDGGLPAFGTEQGRIVSARFLPDGGGNVVIGAGERLHVHIEAEYDQDLPGAAISVTLLDRRMLDLAGKFFHLQPDSVRDGKAVAAIEMEFEARLRPGSYFMTLRLESRGMGGNFVVVDKQPAALSLDVTPHEPDFLGAVDIGMRRVGGKRVVALLAIRNEAAYLHRCLQHLVQQGIEICVIDNDSTDGSLDIVRQYLGKGVFRIERQAYCGHFDLVEQLRIKERLAREIEADWFIHHDADEIREAPPGFPSLSAALVAVGETGCNAVNFDEFVFLPMDGEEEDPADCNYVERYRHYYLFAPKPLHRVNAWKKQPFQVDLVTMAGHQVLFPERRVYPHSFTLRHYVALGREHLRRKYGHERVYSQQEIEERKWHGARARFDPKHVCWPAREAMKNLDEDGWDRSSPRTEHLFLAAE